MRILVVEDDRLLNNTLCYNLNTAGYAVDSALTKSAAGSFLTKHQEIGQPMSEIEETQIALQAGRYRANYLIIV